MTRPPSERWGKRAAAVSVALLGLTAAATALVDDAPSVVDPTTVLGSTVVPTSTPDDRSAPEAVATLQVAATATAVPATPTPIPATATAATATPVPPTATAIPAAATRVSATAIPASATPLPATATPIPATAIPATATPLPATATPVPATAIPATATPIPARQPSPRPQHQLPRPTTQTAMQYGPMGQRRFFGVSPATPDTSIVTMTVSAANSGDCAARVSRLRRLAMRQAPRRRVRSCWSRS